MVSLTLRDVIEPLSDAVTPVADSSIDWLTVLVALSGSSVVSGILALVVAGARASAAARRAGYAEAVAVLIARAEYPYRVKRRTSDDPETLSALAARGHDLQERLASSRTWVASENKRMGDLYENACRAIDAEASSYTQDAWDSDPIRTPSDMNLQGWGPADPWVRLCDLEVAIAQRFGWRRAWTAVSRTRDA